MGTFMNFWKNFLKSTSFILAFFFMLPLGKAAILTVDNSSDGGVGSLRQAITDSNASVATFDIIQFNIPASDPGCSGGICTIQPATALPTITDPVEIDGYTQLGSQANSNGAGQGLNTILTIQLDGSLLSNLDGITVATSGGGSRIAGLVINRFGTAGFFGAGINLDDSSDNLIEGNFIGTDPSGTIALGNETRGIFIGGNCDNNIIGGSDPAARNLISGNNERGIFIIGDASGNIIQGNLIGTDITGTLALGNDVGINIQPSTAGTLIGGNQAGQGNVISGNFSEGISIIGFVGPPAMDNVIQGNFIGADVTGTQALGNGVNGISIGGDEVGANLIGGTNGGEGNVIAFNQGAGIFVNTAFGQSILGNSIFENTDLGIDLESGGNHDQAAPVLNSATTNNCVTTVQGTLNSSPNTTYRLEFFSNPSADPSGFGEGKTFIDFLDVLTDGAGSVDFSVDLPTALAVPEFLTATATDQSTNIGDTSEFSNAIEVLGPGVLAFSSANYSADETQGAAVITVQRLCGSQGAVSVDFFTADGTAIAGLDYTPISGTLNWADGEVVDKTFDVEILNDALLEGNETVLLNLENPTGGAGLGDPSQAVLTIIDTGSGIQVSGGGCQLANNPSSPVPWGLILISSLFLLGIFRRNVSGDRRLF